MTTAHARTFQIEILKDARPFLWRLFFPHVAIGVRITIDRHDNTLVLHDTYRLNRGDMVRVSFNAKEDAS